MQTLVKALPSSLPLMMLPALDQKLPFFRVLILAVITVHIVKMLVLSVYHVSAFMDKVHSWTKYIKMACSINMYCVIYNYYAWHRLHTWCSETCWRVVFL